MVISKERQKIKIRLNDTEIEQVTEYIYLGTIIEENGQYEGEINSRISAAARLYMSMRNGFINKKEISRKTKMNIYKSIYLPTLLYGSESWILTEKQKSKLQAAEMKYLRRVTGNTRLDRIRNVEIRKQLDIKSVQTKDIYLVRPY